MAAERCFTSFEYQFCGLCLLDHGADRGSQLNFGCEGRDAYFICTWFITISKRGIQKNWGRIKVYRQMIFSDSWCDWLFYAHCWKKLSQVHIFGYLLKTDECVNKKNGGSHNLDVEYISILTVGSNQLLRGQIVRLMVSFLKKRPQGREVFISFIWESVVHRVS